MVLNFSFSQLAKNFVDYSLDLRPSDVLYINVRGCDALTLASVAKNYAESVGIEVILESMTMEEYDSFWARATLNDVIKLIDYETPIMKKCDGVLIISDDNTKELNSAQQQLYNLYFSEVHDKIRLKKKWCITKFPSEKMANNCGKTKENLQDLYLKSASINYETFRAAMQPLADLMKTTNRVRIVAPHTDLTFSIKNVGAVVCDGKVNVPDGEVYTAPVRDSVNGTIAFNIASTQMGVTFSDVVLRFEKGKIVESTCNNSEKLNEILDVDEGARYVGEFSFGLNPYITEPINNILFDEKIYGSIHLTPGDAYEDADNGNRSSLHWDFVQIQTQKYGGGKVFFDDVLIRENGHFVLPALLPLNYNNNSEKL